ncbi:MAG: hypothetical protein M1825_005333 [Sarcosagium campestre]|nr:MAG: hypothetical protein M1825_005333 [Sarcosagium campestre]
MLDSAPSPTQTTVVLDEHAFQNERSRELFDAIDKIRNCGFAPSDIDLPQLVIVGDQSAGKSSLLQSLTDVPFPVANQLCTRFPTRIISRRTPERVEKINISIERHALFDSLDDERLKRYSDFTQSRSALTAEDFRDVIQEASEVMGVASPQNVTADDQRETGLRKSFSRDILKIEISGPHRSHFSIVDVPGVFHTLTNNMTADERTDVVEMVSSFMEQKRSIIVCVASGLHDLANQVAFDMAMSPNHDPDGTRTVGVITKCDATQRVDQVVQLAQNNEKRLFHGWFVVRNRSPHEVLKGVDSERRRKKERDFFATEPWTVLPASRRGTPALKKYLADLLCKRIEESFPTLRYEIRQRKAAMECRVQEFSPPRETNQKKREYLANLAQNIHATAVQVLDGRYESVGSDQLKLRMLVRNENESFARKMVHEGHRAPFFAMSQHVIEQKQSNASQDTFKAGATSEIPFQAHVEGDERESSTFQTITFQHQYRHSSFEELRLNDYQQQDLASESFTLKRLADGHSWNLALFGSPEVYKWIREAIAVNKGTELPGTLNPGIIPALFRKQAGRWEEIARAHFSNVTAIVASCMEKVLEERCGDEHNRDTIGATFREANTKAKERGFAHLAELINDTLCKPLQTSDPTFEDRIQEARFLRFNEAMLKYAADYSMISRVGTTAARPLGSNNDATRSPPIAANSTPANVNPSNSGVSSSNARGSVSPRPIASAASPRPHTPSTTQNSTLYNTGFGTPTSNTRASSLNHSWASYQSAATPKVAKPANPFSLFGGASTSTSQPTNTGSLFGGGGSTTGASQPANVVGDFLAGHSATPPQPANPSALFGATSTSTPAPSAKTEELDNFEVKINLGRLRHLFHELHISNSKNLEDEIHDILEAYYTLERTKFVENVNRIVVERYLYDPTGPVLFFSPRYIVGLDDAETDRLAAEHPSLVEQRSMAVERLAKLSLAEKIAQQCA